ncbi:hypothetical protein CABS01_16520 [Colletotrichum abscissum]|uniref:uncharacterized protein n=1 Tax=Colletotrichum abscissum TaxID=1671311 RepID=UPI0027D6613D|nr:uncharacterized protein CABS01_16520 [Colletotrichum abscissum]KAK1521590.1 hypothetical protein CABS01_16520 [Colletotrichum abscissum]
MPIPSSSSSHYLRPILPRPTLSSEEPDALSETDRTLAPVPSSSPDSGTHTTQSRVRSPPRPSSRQRVQRAYSADPTPPTVQIRKLLPTPPPSSENVSSSMPVALGSQRPKQVRESPGTRVLASAWDKPSVPNAQLGPIPPGRLPVRPLIPRTVRQIDHEGSQDTVEANEAREEEIRGMIQGADRRHMQRKMDSEDRAWCAPVPRSTILQRTKAFHESMNEDSTLDIDHCRVCYQQQSPKSLVEYTWVELEPLYSRVEDKIPELDRDHFLCVQCFPRSSGATFPVCSDCKTSLQQEKLPYDCHVNNLSLGCVHRYPGALRDLSPLEERLIGIHMPCGWITKLTIDVEKSTSGRYRKHKRGHITVFPNDVQGLAANVLPHPLVEELERLHVCFVGPRTPVPSDLSFMLSVNPQHLKRALVWLRANNSLYRDIVISEDRLQAWGKWCPGTEVPRVLFERMVPYELRAEDEIRTGHYVPPAERGRPDEPLRDAHEVIASLEDRETDAAQLEAESNARLGGPRIGGRDPDEMDPRRVEEELSELTSTGLMATEIAGEHSPQERLRLLRKATMRGCQWRRGQKRKNDTEDTRLRYRDTEAYIVSSRSGDFADSNDPDFFPKTFPCLFPWGRGGPRILEEEGDDEYGPESDEPHVRKGYKPNGFYLRTWARLCLQRHENRRISYLRMKRSSFADIEQIVTSLTADEIEEAEQEYRETRATSNKKMAYLIRELSAFGQRQHMSNEERLHSRRKIKSLCLKHGMPSVWYTINPNDLTNEVNMKLAAFRVADGAQAEQLMDKFRKQIGRVQHVVRDAVSSAKFFHRELGLFFQHCVSVGEGSIFGKLSCYFGCVETNERGALHLHGLLWLDANLRLPDLFKDIAEPNNAGYAEQCCDEGKARRYRRWESVFADIRHLTEDIASLDEVFDAEANWVAHRCQMHSCGATCTKYSFHDKKNKARNRHPCRFKAPWALRERTEFTNDGLLHVRRNHERINRYSPALAVAMRHNTDTAFLPTNSAGLSMVYYATNYSTKLDTPLWKRAALVKTVFDGMADEDDDHALAAGDGTEKAAQRNNKTRRFLARTANQIFTSRELSAVEVCSNLLGYKNSYCSETSWANVYLSTLYWAVFRRWGGLREAAGPEMQQRVVPETIGFGAGGITLPSSEAYAYRGLLLRELCFYEYVSMVRHAKRYLSLPATLTTMPKTQKKGTTEGKYRYKTDLRHTFHDAVFSLQDGAGVAHDSPGIQGLLETLDTFGFSGLEDHPAVQNSNTQPHAQMKMPMRHLKATKAAQERFHKERMLAIEGDELGAGLFHPGAETGFGDGEAYAGFPARPEEGSSKPAATWVNITAADTFQRAGAVIGADRTLNRMQTIALGLICEALDEQRVNGADRQHLQYIGGGGGTGKSWLIDTLKEVFAAKEASSRLVITATSGTAAAGIGGTTIHSAVGLAFRDAEGATVEPLSSTNLERAKERWRRRDVLVIDETSMLGLQTLYDIDKKLRMLRGFPEKWFGGIPVVVLTGDFLQFPPVLQKSLLSNTGGDIAVTGSTRSSSRAAERRWKESEAKKLWQGFTNVVMLEEQKRAEGDTQLLGFLERLREGRQTREDAAMLGARYDGKSKFDFSGGRRAVIPLNRHRWELTLHAALAYGAETGRRVSIYLSNHRWESRIPTAAERRAAMLLGDEGKLSAAGLFPYVEGMPVVITENRYMGLKVVNGAEFTAAGILHPPGLEEIVITEKLSVFLGPPSGILLRSEETIGLAFPHLPPDTVMLPSANFRVPEKHAKTLRPGLRDCNTKLGLVRTGLPCTPGFALTDFKAQGRTLGKTLLGLYGRTTGRIAGEVERCDPPLNVSQFLEARMPEELVEGAKRLKLVAETTVKEFEARRRREQQGGGTRVDEQQVRPEAVQDQPHSFASQMPIRAGASVAWGTALNAGGLCQGSNDTITVAQGERFALFSGNKLAGHGRTGQDLHSSAGAPRVFNMKPIQQVAAGWRSRQ